MPRHYCMQHHVHLHLFDQVFHTLTFMQGWYRGKKGWCLNSDTLTWWNRFPETGRQHVEKKHSATLAEDPRIRVLKLPPSSIYFCTFEPANGGPPGSYTSPMAIPVSECVNDGEVYPCVLQHAKMWGHEDEDFEEDKKPLETF